jgi:hypothetical protein
MSIGILVGTAVFLSVACYAQPPSSQSIRWNVSELTDLKSDTIQSYESHFITFQSEKVVWVQQTREDTFPIRSVNEDWPDANQTGRIEYEIDMAGQNGRLLIIRQNDLVEISLALTDSEGRQLEYKFKVESFQPL